MTMDIPFSPEMQAFIQEHAEGDCDRLLLSASRYPGIDLPFAADQILARRQIRQKLPAWYADPRLVYPSRLSAEQCSSEETATYKQNLAVGKTLCDLTGGLGVDSSHFARTMEKLVYIERFPAYCEAARHNFKCLGIRNIEVRNADFREILPELRADNFYLDPARRKEDNRRAFALSDCEPDVIQLKTVLLENCRRLIVKISPMADIDETLRLLPETREIHILALRNECKELVFVLENGYNPHPEKIRIHTVNLLPGKDGQIFVFCPAEEKEAESVLAETPGNYLFEPNAALLKGGAFKLCGQRLGLMKLHRHSHLYTSAEDCPDFPGRRFRITETFDFSGKELKRLSHSIPQANITVRNFPLGVAELRKRSGIREGGEEYLFATTLADGKKVLVCCRKP